MPLAGLGWEGEHEANNREPEDLPDNLNPFSGAGVPKEAPDVATISPGQAPIRIRSHRRQYAGPSGHRQPGMRGVGFSGLVIINITAILLMMSLIIMKQIETWRGNAMVWIVCGALLLLTLFEIAQIQ